MAKLNTSGQHDPYWYESFVGLTEVVNLLDPDTDVERVTLQAGDIGGWDDVVVSLQGDRRRCYQVKHTREANSLTFGDMVQGQSGADDDVITTRRKGPLLAHLFKCWRDSGLNDGRTECILYTNRAAGTRPYTTEVGIRRPPLLEFCDWLAGAVRKAETWEAIEVPDDYVAAWNEWCDQLTDGTSDEKIQFFRSMEIRADQDDLEGLDRNIAARLMAAFGITDAVAEGVFASLCRALRKWTTGHQGVTVEELCSELAIETDSFSFVAAPPPPAPFFPSRIPLVGELEQTFGDDAVQPVVFLTGEPGAGKTSVVSRLENQRDSTPFDGLIGIRFFCFEPIRPEMPVVAPDASRVTPEELWYSLLTQLRIGLKGRLHELSVPLSNEFLSWTEARTHVLRLADALGKEHKKRFIIVIDGIDHAARASQVMPQQIADFFHSIPSPDELEGMSVRMLIAGQPSENYTDEYPTWLCGPHDLVRVIELPGLTTDDVRILCAESGAPLAMSNTDEVVRIIDERARGNTLATVFAVQECVSCSDLEGFETKLEARRLADGIDAYYSSIWDHMLTAAGPLSDIVDGSLSGTISMSRRDVSPTFLASVFGNLEQPVPWWSHLLTALSPLLTQTDDGVRVRHNDVRVFLARRFAGKPSATQQSVASDLADWLTNSETDRETAHLQLFDLLGLAGRISEAASVFTVDWVLEAGFLDVPTDKITEEARLAVSGLTHAKDWSLVVQVACAIQTLNRISSAREHDDYGVEPPRQLPPFLPSEARPRPLSLWRLSDIQGLVYDCSELVDASEYDRARDLLRRWLDEMNLGGLVSQIPDLEEEDRQFRRRQRDLGQAAEHVFGALGRLCGELGYRLPIGDCRSALATHARVEFEKGYVSSAVIDTGRLSLDDIFSQYTPMYLAAWQKAVVKLAEQQRWDVVRDALKGLEECFEKLEPTFLASATWWAMQSGADADSDCWSSTLEVEGFRIEAASRHDMDWENERIRALMNVARALGWKRQAHDPGDIGAFVFEASVGHESDRKYRAPMVLIFRTAALIGRLRFMLQGGDVESARQSIAPEMLQQMLTALWCPHGTHGFSFRHWGRGVSLAAELSDVCTQLGESHIAAVVNVAQRIALTYPVDYRAEGVWDAIARTDNPDLLSQWVHHWISDEGEVWTSAIDDAHSIVNTLARRAKEIGEHELAASAQSRLKWRLFGYANRKEYGFRQVHEWFESISERDPTLWQSLGWHLWCICLACDDQGGDNRYELDIKNSVSGAALRTGAAEWWRLASSTFDRANEDDWHLIFRMSFVGGIKTALKSGWEISDDELLTVWTIAVAFSFWLSPDDSSDLRSLYKAILEARVQGGDEDEFVQRMTDICRRRFAQREEDEPEQEEPAVVASDDENPDESDNPADRVASGERINLYEAAELIEAAATGAADLRNVDVTSALAAVGACSDYTKDWAYIQSFELSVLDRIVANVNDEQLWNLIEALNRDIEHASSWTDGVHDNLLFIAHARARHRAIDELEQGLQIQLDTHSRWTYGNPNSTAVEWPPLPELDGSVSWREAAIRLMTILLESYSGEVLGAVLEGIHALVALDPTTMEDFFQRCNSAWSRRWLLSASEPWAALHPTEFENVADELRTVLSDGQFELKLQAWVVLCLYADTTNTDRPEFPIPDVAPKSWADIPTRGPGLLNIPPTMQGRQTLVDRYRSAIGKLRGLDSCGIDVNVLEFDIARRLNKPLEGHIVGPHRRNSFNCTQIDTEIAVGDAIESVLSSEWCDQDAIPFIAQAFLPSEDPWMQRESPSPLDLSVQWPQSDYGLQDVDAATMQSSLRDIAMLCDLPEGWVSFAAVILNSTSREDFELFLWWEHFENNDLHLVPRRSPSTLSGRAFVWWLGDFWENSSHDRAVSAYRTGGHMRLSFCNRELQPAKWWRSNLRWNPLPDDPMTWVDADGQAVARYQRRHGPLRDTHFEPAIRQPVLERWIVSTEAFDQVEASIGKLRLRNDYQVSQFKSP